jgi:hypothetical protein
MKRIVLLASSLVLTTAPAFADETTTSQPQRAPRTAVDPALKRQAPASNLTRAPAATPAGSSALHLGAGGAPVDGNGGQLGAVGGSTNAQATAVAGNARHVAMPKSDDTPPPAVGRPQRRHGTAPRVPDAPLVIAAMGPSFTACLTKADAGVEGPAVISTMIAPNGEVSEATVLSAGGVSSEAVACFRNAVMHAKFAPLGAQGSVLQIRVSPRQLGQGPPPDTRAAVVAERPLP